MKKVAFCTLGCKLNYAETSTLTHAFEKKGYRKTTFFDTPDIFVINTCSVTENADKKCRKLVREAKTVAPNAYIVVVGCYAQLKPDTIADIPGVNAVLGTNEKFKLLELLDGFLPRSRPEVHTTAITAANTFHASHSAHNSRTRTFLKIQDGCDYSCSFCTIPLARGQSRSDTIAGTVAQAHKIAEKGIREIVLTGVNIGDFGRVDGKREARFIDLITALDKVRGIDRFRISSIEPNLITDEIIVFVAQSNRFVPHFHIPLQSGSDKILRLMKRRYPVRLYRQKVERIKSHIPHCCIGVDVIVGFPGEGEKEFMQTHALLNELDISYLHVFTYSERPHTQAASLQESVPPAERYRRSKILRLLSDKKRRAFYQQQVGKSTQVLFEGDIKDGRIHGFTDNYIRTAINHQPHLINQLKKVKLKTVDSRGIMRADLEAALI